VDTVSGERPAPSLRPEGPASRRAPMGFAGFLAVAACVLALTFAAEVCMLLITGSGSERRDFGSYWAAGQQLAHHQNPYNADAVLQMERVQGFPADKQALIMRNPPSALLLVAPFGFVSFRVGALIWSLLLLSCLIGSVRMLWMMSGQPKSRFKLMEYSFGPAFLCLLFGPALLCLFAGQTALIALLGLVLFLRLHQSHQLLAGVSLWLCALKPHLFLPFAAVLLVWIVITRSHRVLVGAILALGASSAVAYLIDPSCWAQYRQMMRTAGIEREFIPCLSIALRFGLSRRAMWLQYIPAAVGCLWAIRYYWSRRHSWDWMEHGGLLMLVSIFVSPYAWLTDQALAIPALMRVAYRTSFRSLIALALASSIIELEVLSKVSLHSALYLWTAPVWLAWYFYAAHHTGTQPEFTSPSAVPAPLPVDLPSPPSPRLTLPG
jgi:Glycosyltransferase family 87